MLRHTHNSMRAEIREAIAPVLSELVSNALAVYTHAKVAHWNVKGTAFIALHELFDQVASASLIMVDDLAERSLQIGAHARGDLKTAAAQTTLPEYPAFENSNVDSATLHTRAVVDALAVFSALTRAAIETTDAAGDAVTADLLTTMTAELDKHLWFVEAHLTD